MLTFLTWLLTVYMFTGTSVSTKIFWMKFYEFFFFSFSQNRIWRFQHNYFHFDPLNGDFNVAGLQFQWDDGIFSITLGNRNSDGYRTAYFHPMARFVDIIFSRSDSISKSSISKFSLSEFAVSTRVLQNEQNAARSNHGSDFQWLGNRAPNSQSSMHDFDRNTGIIFYTQVGINGIGCWNTNTPHRPENVAVLARNNQTMIYPSDLTVSYGQLNGFVIKCNCYTI